MSSIGAAPRAAAPVSNARAEASRRNGAKSRGPKTPEGKARSAQNALKHGLRAQKHVVLPDEDAAAFRALEAALIEELTPEGALQSVLARRIVAAAWRLERAERLEAELFEENHLHGRSLGLALIRDGNGSRSFDTLLRYRSGTLAELWRALRTLKALQAERATVQPSASEAGPVPLPQANEGAAAADREARAVCNRKEPIEPEVRANPGEPEPVPPANEPGAEPAGAPPAAAAPVVSTPFRSVRRPNEPGPGPCEAAPGWQAGTVSEANAPPRTSRDPGAPDQPSRSTP